MNGALQQPDADADERALSHALCMALLRYRGNAESDDGKAEGFMVALAAKFDSPLNELARPHDRAGEV